MAQEEIEIVRTGIEQLSVVRSGIDSNRVVLKKDTPTTPNILYIVLDDLGVEMMDAYSDHRFGQHATNRPYLPNLNHLCDNGIRFDNFYAQPLCGPTRACNVTGRYAFRTGFGTNGLSVYELPSAELGWGELFAAGGRTQYRCQVYGKWHLHAAANTSDRDRAPVDWYGFGRYYGHVSNLGAELDSNWESSAASFVPSRTANPGSNTQTHHYYWRNVRVTAGSYQIIGYGAREGTTGETYNRTTWADSVVRAGLNSLMPNGTTAKFAIMFCPSAPHAPHQVPPHNGNGYDNGGTNSLVRQATIDGTKNAGGSYSSGLPPPSATVASGSEQENQYFFAAAEAIDTEIGALLAGMTTAQLENTIIIFAGDNGSPGDVVDGAYDNTRTKSTVYEGGILAPLFVCNIGSFTPAGPSTGSTTASSTKGKLGWVVQPGRVCDHLVHAVDVLPTIFDLCGVDPNLIEATLDGVSFRNAIQNPEAESARSRVFVEQFIPSTATPASVTEYKRAWIRPDGYKYVINDVKASPPATEEFYNVLTDPLEETDLKGTATWTTAEQAIYQSMKNEVAALVGAWI